jgi:hypothetical protein
MKCRLKAKNEMTIRSSGAEQLNCVSSACVGEHSLEMRRQDENVRLTQRMMATLYDVEVPKAGAEGGIIMTPKELNLKLVGAFPELGRAYREQTDWQEGDDTGSHVVYGDVLVPAMTAQLSTGQYAPLKKHFDFLEELLASGDEYAADVVASTVIESIAFDGDYEAGFMNMLGTETKKIWDGCTRKTIAYYGDAAP